MAPKKDLIDPEDLELELVQLLLQSIHHFLLCPTSTDEEGGAEVTVKGFNIWCSPALAALSSSKILPLSPLLFTP